MRIFRFSPCYAEDGGGGGEANTGTGEAAASDSQELDKLLTQMSTGTDPAATPPAAAATPAATPPAAAATPPAATPPAAAATPPAATPPADKQGYAFAQMRTQNTQLLDLVGKIAQAAGIEYKDTTELLTKLGDDSITKLAAKQNVPVELLKRMEQLEQRDKSFQQEQMKSTAFLGFQKVKDAYSLTEDELRSFAVELDTAGKNPFMKPIDLEAEYKLTHFDDIVTKKANAAVQAALAKSSAADNHSSKPNSANGKPDSGVADKVSTVAGLNSILKDM